MLDQAFAISDIPKLFFLVFLEIILSADNAIVLGVIAAQLPEKSRTKALYIGLISAFIIRAGMIITLSYFIENRWIQILGAFYLLFLSVQYLTKRRKTTFHPPKKQNLWLAIARIELFDIIFALDSILAAVAFISSNDPHKFHSKIWIVYVGGMIGITGVRFAAHIFTKVISKFPNMERSAYLLIAWIGVKLIYEIFPHPIVFEYIFWGVFAIIFLIGFRKSRNYVK